MLPLIVAAALLQPAAPLGELSGQQIREAIELGRTGSVPIVLVGAWLGVSKGDFDVFIEDPIARIAAAASRAFRRYEPFDAPNVTDAMKAPLYRVFFRRTENDRGPFVRVERVVLQPKGAKGMEGVVQPFKGGSDLDLRYTSEAHFDRFPDGEFDVVLATTGGPQKYNVSEKLRSKTAKSPASSNTMLMSPLPGFIEP